MATNFFWNRPRLLTTGVLSVVTSRFAVNILPFTFVSSQDNGSNSKFLVPALHQTPKLPWSYLGGKRTTRPEGSDILRNRCDEVRSVKTVKRYRAKYGLISWLTWIITVRHIFSSFNNLVKLLEALYHRRKFEKWRFLRLFVVACNPFQISKFLCQQTTAFVAVLSVLLALWYEFGKASEMSLEFWS